METNESVDCCEIEDCLVGWAFGDPGLECGDEASGTGSVARDSTVLVYGPGCEMPVWVDEELVRFRFRFRYSV